MKNLKEYIFEAKREKLQPKTKDELIEIIKSEVKDKGWECDLNHIDTSKITDMSKLFSEEYDLNKFDGDISKWDVSKVKNMYGMFYYSEFAGDISKWDVGKVTSMEYMFNKSYFSGDISKWDVSKVKNMAGMFFCNYVFDGDLSKWDVSNVENMHCMFYNSYFHNDSIKHWDVSKVKDMFRMFARSNFNKDISNWNLSPNCDTDRMFEDCDIPYKYRPNVY